MLGLAKTDAEGFSVARDGRLEPHTQEPAADRSAWVAVGLDQDPVAMGTMLRELRGNGYVVQGFADQTAAVVAAQCLPGAHIAVSFASTQTLLTVVFNDGAAVELQRAVRLPGGHSRLVDAWLGLAARTLVQQTRFDPLHDKRCEQALRAALPELAAQANRSGQAEYRVESAGLELPLTLTRDQLVTAAAPMLEPVATALQALAAGLPDSSLLVDATVVGLPGIASLLESAHLARTRLLSVADAACAVSVLPNTEPLPSGGVQYLRRVAVSAANLAPLQMLTSDTDDKRIMATHVVYRGRAIPIDGNGLVIGRENTSADGSANGVLTLPDGVAGLSRRHCTLRREHGRTQIVDHSQHGSFIDGARVRGRAFLVAGSTLRLGTPGIELPLVSLQSAPG